MDQSRNSAVYQVDTGGSPSMGAVHNNSIFGFGCYPDAFGSSGKLVFIINEGNTMFKVQPSSDVRPSSNTSPGPFPTAEWPSDAILKAVWSKMD